MEFAGAGCGVCAGSAATIAEGSKPGGGPGMTGVVATGAGATGKFAGVVGCSGMLSGRVARCWAALSRAVVAVRCEGAGCVFGGDVVRGEAAVGGVAAGSDAECSIVSDTERIPVLRPD